MMSIFDFRHSPKWPTAYGSYHLTAIKKFMGNEASPIQATFPAASSVTSTYDIETWLMQKLAEIVELDPDQINTEQPFASYGLGSKEAIGLSGELEEWLGQDFSPSLVYEYPTIAALAEHLAPRV